MCIIYDAHKQTNISLEIRINWIKRLYPDVLILEGQNGPTNQGYTEEVMKIQENYILSMVPEKIDFFFSSEIYGEHVSKALGAKNIVVDKERNVFPISATKIRDGILPSNEGLHPIVNRDVVKKVLILGAESTGKSTISQYLASIYKTNWVKEYGRDYWDNNHDSTGMLSDQQLLELATKHRLNEEKTFVKSNRIVFIDTGATTTKQFCLDYNKSVPEGLQKLVNDETSRYDLFFLCHPSIPYHNDGTRRGNQIRIETRQKILTDLNSRKIKYYNLDQKYISDRLDFAKLTILTQLNINYN